MDGMKKSLALGIMSGTSIDSVDYALCEIDPKSIRLRELWSARFPKALQSALHAAASNNLGSYAVAQLHHDLGRFYAAKAKKISRIDFVALHGQTIFHHPSRKRPATLQLGEPAYLVESLRAPVVSNFRAADMAAGGQGAPLATLFHQFVFARPGRRVAVNNIGGISNVTFLDGRGGIIAFDTGPGNVLIDMAMRHLTKGRLGMDRDGKWAAGGIPCLDLVEKWLRHDYFLRRPPKSTGRELFGEPFFNIAISQMAELSDVDKVATFTELTARSIALNYRMHLPSLPDEIILTGGGARNRALVRALVAQIPAAKIMASEDLGWPAQAIEPAAFALLGWMRLNGKPGNLPKTTGAGRPALLGQVSRY